MPLKRIALVGGAYESRGLTLATQRCINLFQEMIPQDEGEPAPSTHYPTPGLLFQAQAPVVAPVRCVYESQSGTLYAVVGQNIYSVGNFKVFSLIGTLVANATTPVSMLDNGVIILICDGSLTGFTYSEATKTFAAVADGAFYGADRIDFLDTFYLLNRSGTGQFYVPPSEYAGTSTPIDPEYIAAKETYPDNLIGILVLGQTIWLIGSVATEPWFDAGATDFPFARTAGVAINFGCAAKYSIARIGLNGYFLSQDLFGHGMVICIAGYGAKRISTHAVEYAISSYAVISDAIGFTYQQEGHSFYQLSFPSADKTWTYDEATQLWHERAWTDGNGVMHRHRANCAISHQGKIVVGDWQNGSLYILDLNTFLDAGAPIIRIRSFPHMMGNGSRVFYRQFLADIDVSQASLADFSALADETSAKTIDEQGNVLDAEGPLANLVSLRWSDDGGQTYGQPVTQSFQSPYAGRTSLQWQRLGMARDRVFELSWSANVKTSLSGAFLDFTVAGS